MGQKGGKFWVDRIREQSKDLEPKQRRGTERKGENNTKTRCWGGQRTWKKGEEQLDSERDYVIVKDNTRRSSAISQDGAQSLSVCPVAQNCVALESYLSSWHRVADSHNTQGTVAATALYPSTRGTPTTAVPHFHSDSGFRTSRKHWCLCA